MPKSVKLQGALYTLRGLRAALSDKPHPCFCWGLRAACPDLQGFACLSGCLRKLLDSCCKLLCALRLDNCLHQSSRQRGRRDLQIWPNPMRRHGSLPLHAEGVVLHNLPKEAADVLSC